MRLDKLSFEIRLERRASRDSSSRRIMRLVPASTRDAQPDELQMFAQACPDG